MGCAASKAAAEELITCTPPPAQVETPVIKQKEPTVTKVDNKLVQVLAAAAPCAQIAPSAEAIIRKYLNFIYSKARGEARTPRSSTSNTC